MSNCTTDYHTVPIQEKPSLKRRKSWLVCQFATGLHHLFFFLLKKNELQNIIISIIDLYTFYTKEENIDGNYEEIYTKSTKNKH